jgi:hypothetical protein
MLVLTKEHIKKYQVLFRIRFGKDVKYEEAHDQLLRLVNLVKETYKPMTKEELLEVEEDKRRLRQRRLRRGRRN